MTNQELFTAVYLGIIAQGGPGYDPTCGCHFRTSTGRKCAIGQVIPEDRYDPRWDNGKLANRAVLREIAAIVGFNLTFAECLQEVHDDAAVCAGADDEQFLKLFREEMAKLAGEFSLEVPNVPR